MVELSLEYGHPWQSD